MIHFALMRDPLEGELKVFEIISDSIIKDSLRANIVWPKDAGWWGQYVPRSCILVQLTVNSLDEFLAEAVSIYPEIFL